MNKPSRTQLGQFGPYSTPTIPYLYHNPTLPLPLPLHYPTPPHPTPPHHITPHHTIPHHITPHLTTPYHTLLYLYFYPTPTIFYPYPILPLPYPPLPYFTPTLLYPYHTPPHHTLPLSYPTPTRPYPYHILPLPYPTLYTWQAFLLKGNFILFGALKVSTLKNDVPIYIDRGTIHFIFVLDFFPVCFAKLIWFALTLLCVTYCTIWRLHDLLETANWSFPCITHFFSENISLYF